MKEAENDKKVREGQEKAEAKKARIAVAEAGGATIVGKGGNDAVIEKDKAATIKANLDSQTKPLPKAGTGRKLPWMLVDFARNAWTETSVDADTTVNDNKDNKSGYFHLVLNGLLKPLGRIASNGTIQKCISIAKHCIDIVRSSVSLDSVTSPVTNNNEIVPDSGTTSHMRKDISIFEDDYVTCNNVFVLMGDGAEIFVVGYGTSRMKIDSHVTCLINSLHVPGLDFDLFSCTRHGMMEKGCSFFLGDKKMHLTFLKFTISDDIPVNGDLRILLDPLTEED